MEIVHKLHAKFLLQKGISNYVLILGINESILKKYKIWSLFENNPYKTVNIKEVEFVINNINQLFIS